MVAKKVIIPSAKFSMLYSTNSFREFCLGKSCKECILLDVAGGKCESVYNVIKDNLVVIEEVLED